MKKKTILSIFCVLFFVSLCHGETIYLKNGNKIEGKIVEQTDRFIRVDISGVTLTYYLDDIKGIEGASLPAVRPNMPVEPRQDLSNPVPSLPQADKKALVLRYLEVSGTQETLDRMFKQAIAEAPQEEALRLKQAYDINEITEILVPVYSKYFSANDLRDLIAFYQSPVAQKMSEMAPKIMEDTLDASAKYFQAKIPPAGSP